MDDKENANKCRIIGVNGHNIGSFEVYEVAGEANSFTDRIPRLIYIDHSGLYIVSEEENPIEDISKDYFRNRKFEFKGKIIKISAIDGKREMSGFDKNQKEIFAFNCLSDTPVSFGIEATPVMKQIEEITGVKLITPPPSKESALKRMAEILDVPRKLLRMKEGKIYIGVERQSFSLRRSSGIGTTIGEFEPIESLVNNTSKNYKFDASNEAKMSHLLGKTVKKYELDTSDEAKKRRREIALKPWDEE